MPPARVSIVAQPGEQPIVNVNGIPLPAVASVQVTATATGVPQVSLVLAASQIDVDTDAQVTILRSGPSASEFADQLDPRRLEADALQNLDEATQGEAFVAAVRAQASDYDDHG